MSVTINESTKDKNQLIIEELLKGSGVAINGNNPWDIQIHNPNFYRRVLRQQQLGFGEAYMDGWWDCDALDVMFTKIIQAHLEKRFPKNLKLILRGLFYAMTNVQTHNGSKKVGQIHYDVGNALYQRMLDPYLNYSCGYWHNAVNLEQAQINKMDLICRKLQLKPGMKLLDIGCGWGGMAKYAAEKYGVDVTGITISKQQKLFAEKFVAHLPVKIELKDYRQLNEKFDAIVSIGMFEHVGHKNYGTYVDVVKRCLADNGLFLLHTIGCHETTHISNSWITKYIFPNSEVPSLTKVMNALNDHFILEDLHNFGADYDKTLMAWYKNFNYHWPEINHYYDERFRRMWTYYLMSAVGAFRSRDLQLWQFVLSKGGLVGGYRSVR